MEDYIMTAVLFLIIYIIHLQTKANYYNKNKQNH